jgi:SAM-dependent methyltransferase
VTRPAPPLWSFGGGPGTAAYACFDAARNRLNVRLAAYLDRRMAGAWSPRPRTLEAGSGPGRCSSLLAGRRRGLTATLLDFDPAPLRLATARDGDLRAVRADLGRMPFADGAFDLVFNSSTMEHLDDFGGALAEMARVTRPGGRVFVGVPYRFGPFLPFVLLPPGSAAAVWMGRLYGRAALEAACADKGLAVEECRRYFFGCFIGLLMRRTAR